MQQEKAVPSWAVVMRKGELAEGPGRRKPIAIAQSRTGVFHEAIPTAAGCPVAGVLRRTVACRETILLHRLRMPALHQKGLPVSLRNQEGVNAGLFRRVRGLLPARPER